MDNSFRFSGHESFHCRHYWLKKGVDFLHDGTKQFASAEAVVDLGVGSNMVRSIHFWLKAFDLVNLEDESLTELATFFFLNDPNRAVADPIDPYLEDEGTLWILHFLLVKHGFSSIYPIAFGDFRRSRISTDFTEEQLKTYILRLCEKQGVKISENTVNTDIKVFLRSYLSPNMDSKLIEDELSALFYPLKLILALDSVNDLNQKIFRFNYGSHRSIAPEVYFYCMRSVFNDRESISFDELQQEVSDVLLCDREQTSELIEKMQERKLTVYLEDAGRKELQIKTKKTKEEVLEKYYG
ncbi:MAG: DUF4007 family protein [Flavobacteriales bacterium]|nr:DUF4007 family protein [Flavobacteriales bacterium]